MFSKNINKISKMLYTSNNKHLLKHMKNIVIPCANANSIKFLPYPKNGIKVSEDEYLKDFAKYVMYRKLIGNGFRYDYINYNSFVEKF